MARKFTSKDFQAHERTYAAFMAMTKWSVLAIILAVIALYCFIVASNPVLGGLLLAVAIVLPAGKGLASLSRS